MMVENETEIGNEEKKGGGEGKKERGDDEEEEKKTVYTGSCGPYATTTATSGKL